MYNYFPPMLAGPHEMRLSASTDGVTKLGHYANAASANTVKPVLSTFYAAAQTKVEFMTKEGRLGLKAALKRGVGGAEQDSEDEEAGCSTNIHAARTEAVASGPCNVYGLICSVCVPHTIPVRGSCIDMTTAEQFVYYLVQIKHIMYARPELKDLYIDNGCRIKHSWLEYVEAHPEMPQEWEDLRIMVNWMHGSAHDLKCELLNSARFKDDAARRVGENTEQLWSMLKVCGE